MTNFTIAGRQETTLSRHPPLKLPDIRREVSIGKRRDTPWTGMAQALLLIIVKVFRLFVPENLPSPTS